MEEKSASVLKSRVWKVIGGTTKPFAYRVFIMVHFPINLSLSDWVNSQRLLCPLVCLGDGHDGVWNLFEEIGSTAIRKF